MGRESRIDPVHASIQSLQSLRESIIEKTLYISSSLLSHLNQLSLQLIILSLNSLHLCVDMRG